MVPVISYTGSGSPDKRKTRRVVNRPLVKVDFRLVGEGVRTFVRSPSVPV